jgi:hypothetical protein
MENATVHLAATAVLAWLWILSYGDPIQEFKGARFSSRSQSGLPKYQSAKVNEKLRRRSSVQIMIR